jgi:hypothetical protein
MESLQARGYRDKWDFHTFIGTVRSQIRRATALVDNASDLELAFAICEQAIRNSQYLDDYENTEPYAYYTQAQRCCTEYICTMLKSAQIQLRRENNMRLINFTISTLRLEAHPWTFLWTTQDIENRLAAICSCVQSTQLSSIHSWFSIQRQGSSTCFVYLRLVGYVLEAAIKTHAEMLLQEPRILAFLHPRGVLDTRDVLQEDCQNEDKCSTPACMQCDIVSLSTLIPQALSSWGANVSTSIYGTIRSASALFQLVNYYTESVLDTISSAHTTLMQLTQTFDFLKR